MINGRYELVEELGRGGMASIWLGRQIGHSGFQKLVAIKKLSDEHQAEDEYFRHLTDEARIQVSLKHPNIVEVYSLEVEDEKPYLIMEFIEGTNLRDILRQAQKANKPIPLPLACFIILDIAKGLDHAHKRRDPKTGEPLKIVHRDISPSNILISVDGDVKISDFGIAKSTLKSSETQVGHIKGKFRYMSPEQALGKTLDARSDLFSLGLLFYELLTSKPAYSDPQDIKVFQLAQLGIVNLPDEMEPSLKGIIAKLSSKEVDERYVDAQAFIQDLKSFMLSHHLKVSVDDLRSFIQDLDMDEIRRSSMLKEKAQNYSAEGETVVLDTSKKINPRYIAAVVALLLSVGGFVFLRKSPPSPTPPQAPAKVESGSLTINAVPNGSEIRVSGGGRDEKFRDFAKLSDVKFGIPMTVTVSHSGYVTSRDKITLTEYSPNQVKEVVLKKSETLGSSSVVFSADPFASVSIDGLFSSEETPFKKVIPSGMYKVVFSHPPSGESTSTVLKVDDSGKRIVCSARFSVSGNPLSSSCH